jgi:hypothetical protein
MQPKGLERRLIDLERKADPASNIIVTVFAVRHFGDVTQPYFIEYDDHTWQQDLGESLEDFMDRAKGLAQLLPAPTGKIFLCARRPKLQPAQSRERCLDEQHGPSGKTIVGDA